MSDLVGDPEDRFSHEANFISLPSNQRQVTSFAKEGNLIVIVSLLKIGYFPQ